MRYTYDVAEGDACVRELLEKGEAMRLRQARTARARVRSARGVALLVALALAAAGALVACGGSSETASTSDEGGGAAATAAATVDYAALLTQDDVRTITGHADATPMPESDWHQREGTSKYFDIYQGKDWPEALWLRVGHAGMFEEQRGASDKAPETIDGLGDDAFWWEYTDTDRGIAVLVGDTTYIVSTGYAWNKPQVTDDQLLELTQTILGRL